MDLENSRDELLYEIHRQPQQSPTSLLTVKTYFKGVAPLNVALEKKVKWGWEYIMALIMGGAPSVRAGAMGYRAFYKEWVRVPTKNDVCKEKL